METRPRTNRHRRRCRLARLALMLSRFPAGGRRSQPVRRSCCAPRIRSSRSNGGSSMNFNARSRAATTPSASSNRRCVLPRRGQLHPDRLLRRRPLLRLTCRRRHGHVRAAAPRSPRTRLQMRLPSGSVSRLSHSSSMCSIGASERGPPSHAQTFGVKLCRAAQRCSPRAARTPSSLAWLPSRGERLSRWRIGRLSHPRGSSPPFDARATV